MFRSDRDTNCHVSTRLYVVDVHGVPCFLDVSVRRSVVITFPRIKDDRVFHRLGMFNVEDDEGFYIYKRSFYGYVKRKERLSLRISTGGRRNNKIVDKRQFELSNTRDALHFALSTCKLVVKTWLCHLNDIVKER